jgi:hypothetical protein
MPTCSCERAGAFGFTNSGSLNRALSVYISVSIWKFGSKFFSGCGPVIGATSTNDGFSGTMIAVAIGPPRGWVIEYTCQPDAIVATASAVKRSPGFRL